MQRAVGLFDVLVNRPYCSSIGELFALDSEDEVAVAVPITLLAVEFILFALALVLPAPAADEVLAIAEAAAEPPVLLEVIVLVDYKCK